VTMNRCKLSKQATQRDLVQKCKSSAIYTFCTLCRVLVQWCKRLYIGRCTLHYCTAWRLNLFSEEFKWARACLEALGLLCARKGERTLGANVTKFRGLPPIKESIKKQAAVGKLTW